MKRLSLCTALAALTIGALPGAIGQQATTTAVRGPAVSVDATKLTGEVTAIDSAKRRIRIEGDNGRVATMVVGPKVPNFDKLKVGDEVTMRYTEAVSLAIAKGGIGTEAKLGEIRTKVEADAARVAADGKPGISAMQRSTVVANVFEIDRERGILTLRGTDGVPVDIKVPDKQALQQFAIDDQVVIGYREAATISIEPGDTQRDASSRSVTPAR